MPSTLEVTNDVIVVGRRRDVGARSEGGGSFKSPHIHGGTYRFYILILWVTDCMLFSMTSLGGPKARFSRWFYFILIYMALALSYGFSFVKLSKFYIQLLL